ncbi:hypothetical protein G3N95_35835 [Paraburkholderia sp. Tr-20389]|uniref:hypothetical protein n=1 Tax=Paraburkholderia sp. Tr-20389 TaxID=2703903 RepID=UPI00197DFBEE|nr:hypothetical protein [Paraburkholderia sp. Tr-20389]MBN3758329.1 hypothetical protein [Paraburkholderia sp. Tr-20389]
MRAINASTTQSATNVMLAHRFPTLRDLHAMLDEFADIDHASRAASAAADPPGVTGCGHN